MSKFINALAVAVLGIAMLMGAAMAANTADAVVTACVVDQLAVTQDPTDPVPLDLLPATVTKLDDMSVKATVAWSLTAEDADAETKTGNEGKMVSGTEYLTNALKVNTKSLGANPVEVDSGSAIAACSDAATPVDLVYDQALSVANDDAGTYSITVLYTLSEAGT